MEKRKGGRIPKNNKTEYRCSVNFTKAEHDSFLTLYELSGVHSKASFIKARIFDESFRVIKVDRTLLDYYQKLSSFYAQFRGVTTNYNQVVVALKSNFTEKKALAFLYKLEKLTEEMVSLNRQIIAYTEEFKAQWSQKSM